MNKDKIMKRSTEKRKLVSIRIPLSACKFMNEKNYSPTGIMLEALSTLGWKE